MDLLVVESPQKAKTIRGFLDNNYIVFATKGHIKDLPVKEFGIRFDKTFQATWELQSGKKQLLQKLRSFSQTAKKIYIATDNDREGERIAWDVVEYLNLQEYYRITFSEITPKAVKKAINDARYIDKNIVNAQMARRMIDRIIGYPISEIIRWYFHTHYKMSKNQVKHLGIGRVSAPALRLIVDAERKIEEFVPKQYKKVAIDYFYEGIFFRVKNKVKFLPNQMIELEEYVAKLHDPNISHIVQKVEQKINDVPPPPPLTTTWLQRAANYLFGFSPDYTMRLAQKLYEGVDIGGKNVGLITYIRTESHYISEEVVPQIVAIVKETYTEEYTYNRLRAPYAKEKGVHEAIRPVYFDNAFHPKNLKEYLPPDLFKLYEFIFYRTLAVFMRSALIDRSIITVDVGGHKFYAYANSIKFDGWLKIGRYWKNIDDRIEDLYIFEENTQLPETIYPQTVLDPLDITVYEVQERRPPRYGVGRFITTLEKYQIARPSTIGSVVPQLEQKGYINIVNNFLIPTPLGKKLCEFLDNYAPWLTDFKSAKEFEEKLDLIEKGKYKKDELIAEYEELRRDFEKRVGFVGKKRSYFAAAKS